MVKECIVKVLSAKEGVAISWLDLKDTLLDLKDTDVKSSTAKIENSNAVKYLFLLLRQLKSS